MLSKMAVKYMLTTYHQDFIDDAIQRIILICLLKEFEEQAIDELEDEGYKQNTVEAG